MSKIPQYQEIIDAPTRLLIFEGDGSFRVSKLQNGDPKSIFFQRVIESPAILIVLVPLIKIVGSAPASSHATADLCGLKPVFDRDSLILDLLALTLTLKEPASLGGQALLPS